MTSMSCRFIDTSVYDDFIMTPAVRRWIYNQKEGRTLCDLNDTKRTFTDNLHSMLRLVADRMQFPQKLFQVLPQASSEYSRQQIHQHFEILLQKHLIKRSLTEIYFTPPERLGLRLRTTRRMPTKKTNYVNPINQFQFFAQRNNHLRLSCF